MGPTHGIVLINRVVCDKIGSGSGGEGAGAAGHQNGSVWDLENG